jgi:hypothetical protein
MNKPTLERTRRRVARETVNAERETRPAPEFLSEEAAKSWKTLPAEARIYISRRLDELHAAPERRESKLAGSLGFASGEALRAVQNELAPFVRHAARRDMTLADYIAFFAGNEARTRQGDVSGALRNLIAFVGLDPAKLGRGMISLSAALQLPRFDAALKAIFAAFAARSIDNAGAVAAAAKLAWSAEELGLKLRPDASRFDVAETA